MGVLIALGVGCGGGAPTPEDLAQAAADLAMTQDLAPAPDLRAGSDIAVSPDLRAAGDLAPAPDLASALDLRVTTDIASPPDLRASLDLASPPDLRVAADLAIPDLAAPDIAVSPDLAMSPDLARPPDLAVPPDLAPPLQSLDDEFNDSTTLARWTDLYPNRHDILDINSTVPGALALAPVQTAFNHWYSDNAGPMLYKNVTGNFVVEAAVNAGRRGAPNLAPRGQFNAAGFVLRDAASTSPGGQRWVMYNIGFQIGTVAREAKTTRPGAPDSLSTLYLNDAAGGLHQARLRVCRLGTRFHFFYRGPNDNNFIEEQYTNATNVQGNGAGQATPGATLGGPLRFDRPDLSPTLQVGLIAGNWAAPLEVRGDFDFVRFRPATQLADCTATF